MRIWSAIFLFVLVVAAASAADLSEKELKEAKKIYLSKCAKCHEFYPPADYSKTEWDRWMVKMRKKSKLKPEQFDLVERYTETLRHSDSPSKK